MLTLAYLQNRATKIIDWMMELPDKLTNKLSDFVVELEEKEKMDYVTTVERHIRAKERQKGWEEGEQKGKSKMLLHLLTRPLTRRFGDLPQ